MAGAEEGRSGYRYRAFISYSHLDHAQAVDLQTKLEQFVLPRATRASVNGMLHPRRPLRPVFRDETELVPGQDLPGRIKDALEASEYLIVVCSPNAAASEWVNKEVEDFIALGRRDSILSVVVGGQPDAVETGFDPATECMPVPLRKAAASAAEASGPPHGEQLWVDWRGTSRSDRLTFLRLVAALLALQSLDELVRRDARERRLRAILLWGGVLAAALIVIAAGLFYAGQVRDRMFGRSQTLAGLAQLALAASDYESAGRLALIGMEGFDLPLVGFTPTESQAALQAAVSGSRRIGAPVPVGKPSPTIAAFAEGGDTLLVVAGDGTARVIDTHTGERVGAMLTPGPDANAYALSPDGLAVAAITGIGGNYALQLIDVQSGVAGPVLHGEAPFVDGAVFSHEGKVLAVITRHANFLGAADIWDVAAETRRDLVLGVDAVSSVAFSHDDKTLATGVNGGFALWDLATTNQIGDTFKLDNSDASDVWSIGFSPDDKWVALGSWAGHLRVWDLDQNYAGPGRDLPAGISGVQFASDSRSLVAMLRSGEIAVVPLDTAFANIGPLLDEPVLLVPAGDFAVAGDGSVVGLGGGFVRRWHPLLPLQPITATGRTLMALACAELVPGDLSRLRADELAPVLGVDQVDACP